jgi:hypothetical protein
MGERGGVQPRCLDAAFAAPVPTPYFPEQTLERLDLRGRGDVVDEVGQPLVRGRDLAERQEDEGLVILVEA